MLLRAFARAWTSPKCGLSTVECLLLGLRRRRRARPRARRKLGGSEGMSRRVAVVTLWPPRCITPYFLIFVIISKRVVPKRKRRDEVARSRSLRSVQKSAEKKRRKTGFSRRLNWAKIASIALQSAYDPSRSSKQQCRSSKHQCSAAQCIRLHPRLLQQPSSSTALQQQAANSHK